MNFGKLWALQKKLLLQCMLGSRGKLGSGLSRCDFEYSFSPDSQITFIQITGGITDRVLLEGVFSVVTHLFFLRYGDFNGESLLTIG